MAEASTNITAARSVVEKRLVRRQSGIRHGIDTLEQGAQPLRQRDAALLPFQLVHECDTHRLGLAHASPRCQLLGQAIHLLAADVQRHDDLDV
jgi:hypothetical protein